MRAADHGSCGADRTRLASNPERGPQPAQLPEHLLCEIIRHAEEGYPYEVCGMVIGLPGVPETYRVRPVANLANREPQEDPSGGLRDARTAYKMDPLEQLRVLREADASGWDALLFYHSHPDHGAYFSHMDRARALAWDGEPLWPGAIYLVVSVFGGKASEASEHVWDERRREFVARPVGLPRSTPPEDGPDGARPPASAP